MTTRREYAASLGLAKPNTRGRLSKEAHEAIAKAEADGMVFTDNAKAKPVVLDSEGQPVLPKPKKDTVMRHVRAYRAKTHAGQVIEFGHCSRCKMHVKFCKCQDGPWAPDWLTDLDTWEAVE